MRSLYFLLPSLLTCVAAAHCEAVDHLVLPDGSGDFATIQEAVLGSTSGDVILLGDGTFTGPGNRNINVDRSVTIRGRSEDRAQCFIDVLGSSQSPARGFVIDAGPDVHVRIEYVTIERAYRRVDFSTGGAVFVAESSLSLHQCTIRTSNAEDGGAIGAVENARVELSFCSIKHNIGFAALNANGASFDVRDTHFEGNGYGIHGELGATVQVEDCLLVRNSRAGIYMNVDGRLGVVNTEISDNGFSVTGGGIRLSGSTHAKIVSSTIRGNNSVHSFSSGGGLAVYNRSRAYVTSTLITGNRAGEHGGGISVEESSRVWLRTSTVAGNSASGDGGGIYQNGGAVHLENSIVSSNCGEDFSMDRSTDLLTAKCSITGTFGDANGTVEFDEYTFELDPLFCDPYPCAAPTVNGDYSLDASSPALPEGSACGAPIGAVGQGCGVSSAQSADSRMGALKSVPNPATRTVFIRNVVPGIPVRIFDSSGRLINVVHAAIGSNEVEWNLVDHNESRVPAGVYFARSARHLDAVRMLVTN